MSSITRRECIKAGAGAAVGLAGFTGRELHAAAGGHQPSRSRPNLLFIMTDQQRWDALSRAGNKVIETPNLDRLAREGTYFENAYSTCPVCVPARMSMLTGHGIQATGIRNNSDHNRHGYCKQQTFDNILASRGWWTEYYGKWHAPVWRAASYKNKVTMPPVGPGLAADYRQYLDRHVPDRKLRKGERRDDFARRPYIPDPLDVGYGLEPDEIPKDSDGKPLKVISPDLYGRLLVPAEHMPTALYADRTIEALERCKDKPFSITCSIHHPHSPMLPCEPYYGMYPANKMPLPHSIHDPMDNSPYAHHARLMTRYRDKSKIGYMISDYYGLVKEVDDHVGRIMNKLKVLGLDKNTLVIFTSDHGEMLGDHGMREKAVGYEGSAHVPLMMRWPGVIPANTVVSEPVSQLNLFATINDYMGIPQCASHGRSMRRLMAGKDKGSFEYAVVEWDSIYIPNYVVRTNEWKFLFTRDEKKHNVDALYNLIDDPHEMNNLIGRNPNRSQSLKRAQAMKEMLIAWLERTDSPHLDLVKDLPIL